MADRRLVIRTGNRTLTVAGDRIAGSSDAGDAVIELPGCELRPGLINAHEHLHRNHYGRLGNPPYRDAYAWARDIQRRHRTEIAAGRALPRREALLAGAWKNLFAGVTTLVHHDRWEPDFKGRFPLRIVRVPSADSLGMTPHLPGSSPDRPFALHLAEGVGKQAADEVRTLERRKLLNNKLIAVHGVGMDSDAIARFRRSGAALVWCPSSNLFLFGRTASPDLLADGIDVLLGSDSLLTADGDLLDELRGARATGLLADHRLEASVGETAARRLGLPSARLFPGERADLVVLSKPLLEARAEDVVLVVVGGVPRVARTDLAPQMEQLGFRGLAMRIGGIERWVSAEEAT